MGIMSVLLQMFIKLTVAVMTGADVLYMIDDDVLMISAVIRVRRHRDRGYK